MKDGLSWLSFLFFSFLAQAVVFDSDRRSNTHLSGAVCFNERHFSPPLPLPPTLGALSVNYCCALRSLPKHTKLIWPLWPSHCCLLFCGRLVRLLLLCFIDAPTLKTQTQPLNQGGKTFQENPSSTLKQQSRRKDRTRLQLSAERKGKSFDSCRDQLRYVCARTRSHRCKRRVASQYPSRRQPISKTLQLEIPT